MINQTEPDLKASEIYPQSTQARVRFEARRLFCVSFRFTGGSKSSRSSAFVPSLAVVQRKQGTNVHSTRKRFAQWLCRATNDCASEKSAGKKEVYHQMNCL